MFKIVIDDNKIGNFPSVEKTEECLVTLGFTEDSVGRGGYSLRTNGYIIYAHIEYFLDPDTPTSTVMEGIVAMISWLIRARELRLGSK